MTNCPDRSITNVNFCGLTSLLFLTFSSLQKCKSIYNCAMSTSLNNCLTKTQAGIVTVIHSMDYSNSSSQENAQYSEDALSNFNDQILSL